MKLSSMVTLVVTGASLALVGIVVADDKEATCPVSGHKFAVTDKSVSLTVNGQTNSFIVISPQFTYNPSASDVNSVIDYAISHKLQRVEAGAGGQHKVGRGYMPTTTYSAHYIVDPSFRRAVDDYLKHERAHVAAEVQP